MSYEVVGLHYRYGEPEVAGQAYWHVTLKFPEQGHVHVVGMINVPAATEQEARNTVIACLVRRGDGDDHAVVRTQDSPHIIAHCDHQSGYDDPAAMLSTREGLEAVMAKHPASRKMLNEHYGKEQIDRRYGRTTP